MATRYYTTHKNPGTFIRGPYQGTWEYQAVGTSSKSPRHGTRLLQTTKDSSCGPQDEEIFACNQQGNFDFASDIRYITPPLAAQSISGTFNLCFGMFQDWTTALGQSNNSVVQFKLFIYLTDGQSTDVKTVLLDNYIDPTAINYANNKFTSLTSAQALAAATAAEGDSIIVEFGWRVVSSPTPTPTYPPTDWTRIGWASNGTDSTKADAVAGEIVASTSRAAWMEFSMNLAHAADAAAPANDSCAEAITIAAFPYASAQINTIFSTDLPYHSVWWKFTATRAGFIWFTCHGSNYRAGINIYSGNCAALSLVNENKSTSFYYDRSIACTSAIVEVGVEYFVKVEAQHANNAGGSLKLNGFYREEPLQDDLYIASGSILALRDGQMVNVSNDFLSFSPTGIGIDYTQRPLVSLIDGSTNTNIRLLIGLFGDDLIEIVNLDTLNIGTGELDWISDPFRGAIRRKPAQFHLTAAGMLHVGFFGNGFLYVVGRASGIPALMNTVSNDLDLTKMVSISAVDGDNQSGAPYTATERELDIQVCSPWAIALDEATGVMYYTSGGFYEPVGGDTIKRYNINTNTQLADFATIALSGTDNPGLKGIALLSAGGLLVCNGNVVTRLNAAGAVIQTYTPPSIGTPITLVSVCPNAAQDKFWTLDLLSSTLWQFNIATGAVLQTHDAWVGDYVQMLTYLPGAAPPPVGDLSGIYFIDPPKLTRHDSYYNDEEKKIPNPTIRTALLGE